MGDKTGISWTDATWNPIRGCSRVSEGCRNCYAERVAARFSQPGMPYHGLADQTRKGSKWTGAVRLIREHLGDPVQWKRPRRIFVNSMSDLFHENLTNEEIAAVFGVMAAAPRHTFQVLTKRAERMREWFEWVHEFGALRCDTLRRIRNEATRRLPAELAGRLNGDVHADGVDWPLANVWLGVSVEDQDAADTRIPELLTTPAAVRFLSCEPLIGPVDLFAFMKGELRDQCLPMLGGTSATPGLNWVIAGCESGPGSRRCEVEWLRSLRDQCATAGVAYFLKQAEESTDHGEDHHLGAIAPDEGSKMKARRPGGNHVIELPYLDGVQHAAFPGVA